MTDIWFKRRSGSAEVHRENASMEGNTMEKRELSAQAMNNEAEKSMIARDDKQENLLQVFDIYCDSSTLE